jgi:hypothetical protein
MRTHHCPEGIFGETFTDLYPVFYFSSIMFNDKSRFHHSWKFNVRIIFMLMLKLV